MPTRPDAPHPDATHPDATLPDATHPDATLPDLRERPGSDPTPLARIKRMRMRAWRRGTREMDLVLGPFADARLGSMPAAELDVLDALMAQNDQDLYAWVTGQSDVPPEFAAVVAQIADFARVTHDPQDRGAFFQV